MFYRKGFFIAYLLGWLLWCLLHVLVLILIGWDIRIAFLDSIVFNSVLGALGFAVINTLKYYQPGKSHALNLFFWIITLSGITVWVSSKLLALVLLTETSYQSFLDKSVPLRFIISFLLIGLVVLLSWIWNNIRNQKNDEHRKADMEKLSREAELASLRQQLQPHFLFNSLNSISSLAGSRPEEARKMIQLLSDFLRGTLKKDDQQLVQLKQEIDHLNLYLEIEKVRFGHRLNTVIKTDEESLDLKIPSLLLQPLVENAVKFGLYDTTGETLISVVSRKEEGNLVIEITNPYDPRTTRPQSGTGFGLSSVQRRLFLLFSRNDLLQTSADENIFITKVIIPQQI